MPRRAIDLDLGPLADFAGEEQGKLPLKRALASGKFAQVGINLFRHQENNTIWQVEAGEDETNYIVRAEPEEEQNMVVESSDDEEWTATSDSEKDSVTLAYRGTPMCRFASKECGFNADSVENFQKYLIAQTKEAAFVQAVYAHATGQCPLCKSEVVSVKLKSVACSNSDCTNYESTRTD